MVQIFSVVSFCHLQGVVHRDLKPEKFLFTSKYETSALKVIDFGLSDFVKPDERLNDIVGNAYYVAPEVLYRSCGTEIDMSSIGVIAYILLCGSRPFWAHTESGIFRAVLKAESSFVEAPWPTLIAEAKNFVKMLLNKDHRKRMTAAQPLNISRICKPRDNCYIELSRAGRARSVVSNWEGRDQSPSREEPTTSDSASVVHRGQLYSSRGSNQAAETPTIVSDGDVLSVLMEQHELFLSST